MSMDSIKFILNGQLTEVSGLSTTMTLLQYLRTQQKLTGTKEGCAEGDCGACTVIVGSLADNKVVFHAVNACIALLPTFDGKEIITVEHLKSSDGLLHPVQQAMVSCHASQCGFCTPGFVMSLAALAHNNVNASEQEIQNAIAGNLCRCTGYRPILDAAKKVCSQGSCPLPSTPHTLAQIQRKQMLSYETTTGKFFAPVTLEELTEIAVRFPEATFLAGGTDVGLWVTKLHRTLDVIIYTANVKELHKITKNQGFLEIGSAVTYTEALAALSSYDPSVNELLQRLGSVQIRNAGTLGGNIANGSPIGDSIPLLIALGAKIVLQSQNTSRLLELENYFIAYKKQDRQKGEFISKILVPVRKKNVLFKTYKVSKRFDQDISAVCGAFLLELKDNIVMDARLAFGGMAETPKRAALAEQALQSHMWDHGAVMMAMKALDDDFSPISDMRASAEYRRKIAKHLLHRFYIDTMEPQTTTGVYNYAE